MTAAGVSDTLSRPMKRFSILLAAAALAASVPAGLADAHANRPDLKLRKTRVGPILVDSRGYTVYAFTLDRPNHDACARMPGCLSAWPALTVKGKGKPTIGPGVKRSLAGTMSWGELAFACGFADQPHLIAEFKAFTGSTPETFLQDAAARAA